MCHVTFIALFKREVKQHVGNKHMVCVRLASTLYYNTNLCARAQCKSIAIIHQTHLYTSYRRL